MCAKFPAQDVLPAALALFKHPSQRGVLPPGVVILNLYNPITWLNSAWSFFWFLHVATAQVHMPTKPPGRGAVGILPGVVTPKHLLSPSATHHKLLNLRHNTWNGKQSKGLWGRRSEPEALKLVISQLFGIGG